jgi:outer membrane protein OmpA-like peptidoglycan-associated protein
MRNFACGCLLVALAACQKGEAPAASETAGATAQPAAPASVDDAPAAATPAPPVADTPSLVSLSAGVFPVQRPSEYSVAFDTVQLLDERANTMWTSGEHKVGPETLVLALPARTVLERVEFDCGGAKATCARDIAVAVSDTDATSGFAPVVNATLKPGEDRQSFAASAAVPGRWVKLTIANNNGAGEYIELAEFRAYGKQDAVTPLTGLSGTYESSLGEMHVKQDGALVTGCYATRGGTFQGGVEGRVMKLDWCDLCGTPQAQRGVAVLVVAPDGAHFIGEYWVEGNTGVHGSGWDGERRNADVGTCPGWAQLAPDVDPAQQQLTDELDSLGRARVYGINFDSDSDKIRDDSKPALDAILHMLAAKPEWKLSIEGHTDSTSTPAHNQELSERRAASVKAWLTMAGVDTARLSTAGMGQDKPVAPNDTAIGRAQNRRVEVVKQ